MRIWQRIRNNMKNLELQKCILGPVYTNCYLLKNKETGELILGKNVAAYMNSRIILKNKVESARECVILQDMFKKI